MSLDPIKIRDAIVSSLRNIGVNEWVVVVRKNKSTMVKFANNVVTVVQSWSSTQVEVYASKDRRMAHIEAFVSGENDCKVLAERIAISLAKSEPSPLYAPLPIPNGKPLEGTVDKRIVEDEGELASEAMKIVDEALRSGAERVAGTFEYGYLERYVYTSTGFEGFQPSTYAKAYARAFKGENSGHWAYGSTFFNEKSLENVGRIAGEYASLRLPVINVEPGEYQAILSPLVVGNLVNYLAMMASAMMVVMGASLFTKVKVGEKAFSEYLTIRDEPLNTSLPGARGFDDEGVACTNKAIIEKGVVKTLLHNSKTAKLMNANSTGNAGLFMPTPWNIVVDAGASDVESMIKDVRKGFLVLNNWYTRMQNWIEGQFSTVTRDALIYIENGEFKGITPRLRIADTFQRLFSNIQAVSKDSYDVWWWEVEVPTRAPYILVGRTLFTKPES